jgi:hypothetical protein
VQRLIVGSTAHYLQRHARSPLLILPREAEARSADGGSESPSTVSA